MKCPTCGNDNPAHAQFCGGCGAALSALPQSRSLVERMIGAALLKPDVYEEVEADTNATSSAALVVVLASLASGVAGFGTNGFAGLIAGVIIGISSWAFLAASTYFIGTRFFPTPGTHADWGQLARTVGFAQAPGVLRVLALIPGVGFIVFFTIFVWIWVAVVIAVRQALDYESTGRAVAVVGAALIPYFVFVLFVFSITLSIFGAEALGAPAEGAEVTPDQATDGS